LILGFFSWTLQTSKSFELPNFLFLDSATGLRRWLKQKRHLFLGRRIITQSPATHIKLSTAEHVESHHFSLLSFNLLHSNLLLTAPVPLLTQWLMKLTSLFMLPVSLLSMRTSASGAESNVPTMSSSSNVIDVKMMNKTTPLMFNYWKKSTITEADHSAYHAVGWLGGGLESLVPLVDVPTLDGSTMICFESHLVVGLGLPPSKFIVAIMNFLWCELVHLNSNAIAALNCFTMLCECWLGIALDTSMF
jgi:hypothetical protein